MMHAPAMPTELGNETPPAGTHSDPTVASLARFAATSTETLGADLFESPKNVSRPKCLLPESVRRDNGTGPVMALDEYCCKLLVVTLGIVDVVERTGLTVSVWGSPDGIDWGAKPMVSFRERQYCGVYSVLLNLAMHGEIRYLRAQWSMNRWGKGERTPVFGFEVFVEESGARISSSAVA